MKRNIAVFILIAICLIIAAFILTGVLPPGTGGLIFAGALLVLGILSKGFRRVET